MILQKYPYIFRSILNSCYLTIFTLFMSCNNSNKKEVDVKNISINFKKIDFYKDLFAADTNHLNESLQKLSDKYPDFSALFFNQLTGFNANNNQDSFLKAAHHFLTYKDFRGLYDTVNAKFPNTKQLDKELESLFKHIKYYFPNEKWGTVYYFISGLNHYSAITYDTLLGIGLDMHLGKNYPYYPSVQLPLYEIVNCEPQNIQINASKAIFESKYPINPDSKNLLDLMIQKGIEMTFVEYTIPTAPDELIMGYTKAQIQWCQHNERMIWSYFKKQNLVFSTQWQQILRYINDGPNSTGMPAASPGNIGTWIGWQIVRKYLNENPTEKWSDLLSKKIDSQQFLMKSKYKP